MKYLSDSPCLVELRGEFEYLLQARPVKTIRIARSMVGWHRGVQVKMSWVWPNVAYVISIIEGHRCQLNGKQMEKENVEL